MSFMVSVEVAQLFVNQEVCSLRGEVKSVTAEVNGAHAVSELTSNAAVKDFRILFTNSLIL